MNQRIKTIKEILFQDENVKRFCNEYNLSDGDIINYLSKLSIQKENNKICSSCNKENCSMDPYGMKTKLVFDGRVDLTYYNCSLIDGVNYLHLDMLYFPNNEDFENKKLIINQSRALALKYIKEFKNSYKQGVFTKGIYFHGPFGCGKTFMMYTLARELSKQNVRVLMAYYPDLVRFIKSSIATSDLESIINKLKYVDILMLDDVGAESNSNFIRDEVLGPILQFRLEANLPICMTSNLSLDLLKEHFSESKDEINKIKSDRIVERVRYLMKEVKLDDKNYRLTGLE